MAAWRIRGKKAKVNFPDAITHPEKRHRGRVTRPGKKITSQEVLKLDGTSVDHVISAGSSTDDATVVKLELPESASLPPMSSAWLDAFELNQVNELSYLEAEGKRVAEEIVGVTDMVFGNGEARTADDFGYYEPFPNFMQLPYIEGNSYENIDALFNGDAVQEGINIGGLWSFDDVPMGHGAY
jgi:EREBP-like factor